MTGQPNPEGYKVFRSVAKELKSEKTPFSWTKLCEWCGINKNTATVAKSKGLLKPSKLMQEASKLSRGVK